MSLAVYTKAATYTDIQVDQHGGAV